MSVIRKHGKKWQVMIRRSGSLDMIDHKEYFSIDRFTGEGVFFYGKTKKSKWKLIKERFKVKCTKVDRAF